MEVAGDGTVSVADQVENFVAKGKATERAIEQVFAEEVKTYAQKLYDHMRACTAKTCERGYLRWAKTSDVTHIQYVPRSMVCTVARRLLDTLKSAQRQLDGARMFGHRQTGGGS